MNQRGFIQLAPMMWGAIAAGALILALGVMVKVQTSRLDAVKAEYATFKGGVEVLGLAAKKEAAKKEAADKANKEKTDAQNKRERSALLVTVERLRRERAAGGGLSSPGPDAGSPDKTCFDPALFAGALRRLDEGILGILESGSQAVIDLDAAKRWASTE